MILDNAASRTLSDMRTALKRNGRCVMAGAPKALGPVMTRLLQAPVCSLFWKQKFTFFIAKMRRQDLVTLGELIQSGKLTPVIDRRYPLTESAAALAYLEEGHARAKVVITLQE